METGRGEKRCQSAATTIGGYKWQRATCGVERHVAAESSDDVALALIGESLTSLHGETPWSHGMHATVGTSVTREGCDYIWRRKVYRTHAVKSYRDDTPWGGTVAKRCETLAWTSKGGNTVHLRVYIPPQDAVTIHRVSDSRG